MGRARQAPAAVPTTARYPSALRRVHASVSGAVPPVPRAPFRMKVLVIEDDPTVGNFVRRGLEEQRWGVQLVADGEEGERLATSDAYDVVILDMRLPGKSGMEVLNGLRARGFERPVLVLTAQDAVDAKVNALRAGADDYVTKPFAFEELLARVEALARRPRALSS